MGRAAGPRYRRPESVLVVVATRNGRVLLLQRRHPVGFWQSVTGSLRWGEAPEQGARRELYEETGLEPRRGQPLIGLPGPRRYRIRPEWRRRFAPGVRTNLEHAFALMLERPRPIRRNPAEHAACRWLPWRLALQRAASWTDRAAIAATFRGRAR